MNKLLTVLLLTLAAGLVFAPHAEARRVAGHAGHARRHHHRHHHHHHHHHHHKQTVSG